jgi:hypothetical protein
MKKSTPATITATRTENTLYGAPRFVTGGVSFVESVSKRHPAGYQSLSPLVRAFAPARMDILEHPTLKSPG